MNISKEKTLIFTSMKKLPLMLLIIIINVTSYGQKSRPIEEITNNSVLIKIPTNGGSGSGVFIINNGYIYLLTAIHVIGQNLVNRLTIFSKIIELTAYQNKEDSIRNTNLTIDLEVAIQSKNLLFIGERDIAIIRFGRLNENRINFFDFAKFSSGSAITLTVVAKSQFAMFKDIKVTTPVIIVGYPKSLGLKDIPQYDFDMPLLRTGIIAGKNFKNKTIVLDSPVYPGNSGGPVMESEVGGTGMKLIGIITQFIPLVETWQNALYGLSHTYFSNSGYSIVEPMDEVIKLIALFEK